MDLTTARFRKFRPKPDYLLVLLCIGMALFGLVMIGSASSLIAFEKYDGARNYYFVGKQAVSLVVGLVLMFIAQGIDYRSLRKYAFILLIVTVILLILSLLPGVGQEVKGAHRWINLGIMNFQPSELAKLTFIIYLSSWFSSKEKINIIPLLLVVAVMAALIIAQPDLGTLTIVVGIALSMFYAAGGSYGQVIIGLGTLGVLFWIFIRSSAYRWERFQTFINPGAETQGAGYHINQAILAVGSGGLMGLGFGKSIQKYLYLPEPYSDSIFAIIAEELGFFRTSLVILAFAVVAWRGFRIAQRAPDKFGKLLAAGITSWIVFQAFINIGAITGMLPLTGVPLPFISYGGSSLIATLAGVGVLANISKQANAHDTDV